MYLLSNVVFKKQIKKKNNHDIFQGINTLKNCLNNSNPIVSKISICKVFSVYYLKVMLHSCCNGRVKILLEQYFKNTFHPVLSKRLSVIEHYNLPLWSTITCFVYILHVQSRIQTNRESIPNHYKNVSSTIKTILGV